MTRRPPSRSRRRGDDVIRGDRSKPDLGANDREPAGEVHPFLAPEDARYQRRDIVGSGGMGTVFVAHDRRLGREVALKQIAPSVDDATTASRLAREAWVTARLEHPGIVPVHDAGVSPSGRLFYTMRLVRGRSLAEAIAAAIELGDRLALLRQFLAACQAVAFAHSRGVVHRDLKPANIMVGEFGETVVVDWGLAGFVDERAASALGPPPDEVAAPLHSAGLGTPAYMSPEQARGAPVDCRTDVWSLGAVLAELVTGLRPSEDARETAPARPRRRAAVVPHVEGAPPALEAIIGRALARDPAARYGDAAELAADVERFLDGRRVVAHAYTSLELLLRLLTAWRVPLAFAGIGLAAALAVFAVTWRRVQAERARAVDAERSTADALVESRRVLGSSLEGQAISAHEAGARPEAEILAAHALTIAESPDARGVIAGAYAGTRPLTATRSGVSGCRVLLPAGPDRGLCLGADGLSLWDLTGQRQIWHHDIVPVDAHLLRGGRVVALGTAGELVVLDVADGKEHARYPRSNVPIGLQVSPDGQRFAIVDNREITVVDPERGAVWPLGRLCEMQVLATVALGTRLVLAVCGDGRAVGLTIPPHADEPPRVVAVPFGVSEKGAFAAAVHADDRRAVISGVDGQAILVDLERGVVGPLVRVAEGPPSRLTFSGDLVLVGADRGGASLWDLEQQVELLRLPAAGSRRALGADDQVVGCGEALWRWRLPARKRPWRYTSPAGLSGAAISPDGRLLAVSRGDGHVTVWTLADGHLVVDLPVSGAVIKRVAFSPDSRRMAVASAGEVGTHEYESATWQPTEHQPARRGAQRIFYLGDGTLIAVHYGDGYLAWPPGGDGRAIVRDGPRAVDAAVATGADTFFLLTANGEVLRREGETFVPVLRDVGSHAFSVSRDGGVVATGHLGGVRVQDLASGAQRWLPSQSGDVLDVGIAPDGRWIVAGTRSGSADVWSWPAGRFTAVLRGHRERSASSAFTPDGRELVTTSWDGTASVWSLAVLETPAEQLVEAAERAWGQDLATTIRARLRGAP